MVQKPALKNLYKNDFLIGAYLGTEAMSGKYPNDIRNVKRQFNSISTASFEWSSTNPIPGIYTFEAADQFVDLGTKNDMFTIGHGLVWHQLVPDWVFENKNNNPTSRDTLLNRMRNHIFKVATRYKNQVNTWIVVNEAIEKDGQLRKTKWLEIIGEDYIQKAFEYAHEADPDAKLYYNDFQLFLPAKRESLICLIGNLHAKGVKVDGIGIQGHWSLDYPSLRDVEESIIAFAKLDVKVMITELDVSVLPRRNTGADISDNYKLSKGLDPYVNSIPDSLQNRLADRYKKIFSLFHKYRNVIDGVTFWGVNDRDSWRNDWPIKGRTDYPLLFDRSNKPKKAFRSVIDIVDGTN